MIDQTRASVFATWAMGLGLVTPVCGFLFSCGCNWPWKGFFMACNAILKNTPPPHCPWCTYPLSAIVSMVIGLAAGSLVAWRVSISKPNPVAEFIYRSGLAVAIVVVVLLLGGWLSGIATGYAWEN